MRKTKEDEQNLWMLFDPAYTLIDQAILESKRGDCVAVLRPVGENIKEAMQMHIVLFSWAEDSQVIYRGEVVSRRGGRLYLENVTRMEPEIRHHLRVRMDFRSKILYVRGGRVFPAPIVSFDLSAGGIAFFSSAELETGEECEVVLPITSIMMVVKMKILRGKAAEDQKWKYAACFLDLSDEEEAMIRQAIFSEQWRRGRCRLLSRTYEGRQEKHEEA